MGGQARRCRVASKTETEIRAILAEYRRVCREGMTKAQFSKQTGVPIRTLTDWQRRFEPKTDLRVLIAKAEALIKELQRTVDASRPAAQPQLRDWQRWILDAACRSAE